MVTDSVPPAEGDAGTHGPREWAVRPPGAELHDRRPEISHLFTVDLVLDRVVIGFAPAVEATRIGGRGRLRAARIAWHETADHAGRPRRPFGRFGERL